MDSYTGQASNVKDVRIADATDPLGFADINTPDASTTVTVRDAATGNPLSSIFSDNIGTVQTNPYNTNTTGGFIFYAANGRYNVIINEGLATEVSINDIVLFDVAAAVVKSFDTLAEAVADTGLVDGDRLTVGDRGNSTWNVVLLSTVTPSVGEPSVGNIVTSTGVPTLALVAELDWSIDIRIIGAIGGNSAIDSAALNLALTLGRDVTIPTISSPYIFSNIQIPRGSWLQGNQKYDGSAGTTSTFNGDGTNPVFLCGDGGATALREITFNNLNGDGNTQEVILGRTSPNLIVKECFFATASATKNTVDLEQCFRSQIERNKISCSGGAFAIQAYADCNGSGFNHNIVTGGALGGAINIGLIDAAEINNNTIETSLIGIQLSANSDTGNGNTNGIDISNNHIEDCSVPFSFGLQFSVLGLTGHSNFVGNTNLTLTADAVIKWGRVFKSTFSGNSYHVNTGEDVYQLHFVQPTGDQENNELGLDNIFGNPTNIFSLKGAFGSNNSVKRQVGSLNYYPFLNDLSTPKTVVFESGTVTANVGIANVAYNDFNPLELGGGVSKVEVFEKQGTITSTLTVGRSASSAEIVNVDPNTLSFTDGRADVTLLTSTPSTRDTEAATYRVIAGAGTGTFRVRITYRVS